MAGGKSSGMKKQVTMDPMKIGENVTIHYNFDKRSSMVFMKGKNQKKLYTFWSYKISTKN